MTTIVAPGGLVNLEAPLARPRQYDLLAAAALVENENERWLAGGWTGGDPPGPAYTHDPCSKGTDRVKAGAGEIPKQMSGRFMAYMTAFCKAQSVGPNSTWLDERLRRAFALYEGAAVERVLATGDGWPTLGNYLGDQNMKVLGGGVVGALRAFELLETEIARHGTGMIHAAPATVAAWDSLTLTENVRNVKRSVTSGNPIVVGAGYIGVKPQNEAAPASDQEWAFASGPIELIRSVNIESFPTSYSEAINRSTNEVLLLAERPYLINWIARQDSSDEDHTQAGVLIDLVP